jgi:predicted ribosomally synthesized peptide with SipW-like signal peptide
MKKKQTIIAAVVLMLVLLVGGLIAYFTDTKSVTNTFTIGKVKIALSEPNWVANDATNLMPNEEVNKDPQIKNDSTQGSTNPAYVFLKVEVPCYVPTSGTAAELFTFTPNSAWTQLSHNACTSATTKSTYVFYYGTGGTLTSLAVDATTPALFTKVKLADLNGNETLPTNVEMPVTGYGIQTEGLTDTTPATVWTNFSA